MIEIDKIKALEKKLEEIGIFDIEIESITYYEDNYEVFNKTGDSIFNLKKEAYEKLGAK